MNKIKYNKKSKNIQLLFIEDNQILCLHKSLRVDIQIIDNIRKLFF